MMRSPSAGESPADQARDDVGVLGNERLTALTGAVLLVLFAVETVTVVLLRGLMPAHFFVGVLLIGPVAVKTASTGWRFLRYYARHPAYRRKGPPRPAMRVLSPLLLVSTLAVIGSGVALALTGPAPALLLRIHVISFLAWLALVIIHVTVYAARLPTIIGADWRRRTVRREPRTGRWARLVVNVAALVAAGIPALALAPTAAPWAGSLEQAVSGFGVLAVVAIATTAVVAASAGAFSRPTWLAWASCSGVSPNR
jgi:hypothetical protein